MGEVPVMGAVLGGVVLIGAPLTVLVFLAMPVDVAAPMVGWTAFVAVVVAVVAALVSRSRGGAAYPIEHASGWSNSHVRRHERGHVNVARALGCYARVDIERGETYVDDGHLPPVKRAAIAFGGEAAAGSGGCGRDRGLAEAHLRQVPGHERGAARREAWRIARRYV
jgi:hypothetical protein